MTPIWFRGYAQDDEDQICQVLDRALEALNVRDFARIENNSV